MFGEGDSSGGYSTILCYSNAIQGLASPGVCQNANFHPIPDLLNLNMHFPEFPDATCVCLKCEKAGSRAMFFKCFELHISIIKKNMSMFTIFIIL